MAFISLIRDLDANIQNASFVDGQVAVAYDKNRLYIDVLSDNIQKRVVIDNDSIRDQKSSNLIYLWVGTQAEYNALATHNSNTLYITTDDGTVASEINIISTTSATSIIYSSQSLQHTEPFLKFVLT